MKNIFPDFALKQLGLFVAIIVIFFYNVVLDKDYMCNCEERCSDCIVYMAMPSGIIFVLQLWMDKTFIYTCKSCCNGCCYVVYHIIKAAFVGLLWVTSVLIDGDWYVCCEINQSEQQKQLACKDKNNLTAEERTTITELKNHSRLWGMILLLCIVVVAAVGSSIGRKKSCGRPCCTDSDCSYTNILYEEVKLDEEENVLREIMKKEAKAEVTGPLENHWQETTGRPIQVEGKWLPLQVCLSPTGNQVEGVWIPLQVCLSPTGNQTQDQTPRADMGPNPGADTGPDPGADTGPDPSADTGPDPGADTGPDPGADTGPDPAADTGPDPAADTGPDPAADTALTRFAGDQF